MLSLYELLTQEAVEEHKLFAACEQLILSVLLYHLVGRPRINTQKTFAWKLLSYAGTFLPQDHLHMLTKVICREQCAVRCTCQACARMLIIRQVYGMLGPAPRLLFKRLTVGTRRTLWVNVFPTWQQKKRVVQCRVWHDFGFLHLPSFTLLLDSIRALL